MGQANHTGGVVIDDEASVPRPEPIACIEPKSIRAFRAGGRITAFETPENTAFRRLPGRGPPPCFKTSSSRVVPMGSLVDAWCLDIA